MKKWCGVILLGLLGLPCFCFAQGGGLGDELKGLQGTLDTVYADMIKNCGELISVSMGIAGFGALWYIGVRVLRHLAKAEPIDLFPLLRPFCLGLAVSLFPYLVALLNGVLQPTVTGTSALVTNSNQAVATLLAEKQKALTGSNDWQMYTGPDGSGDLSKWEQLSGQADSGMLSGISNRVKFEMAKASYNLKSSVRIWFSEILQVLFEAAALCLNTVRTFYLILLAILGPLALGLSVFDGFQHLAASWFARYINVFLWLPVANILGALIGQIQQAMIKIDTAQLQASGQTYFGETDAAYLVFLLMATVGYFTIPSFVNWIVNVGWHGTHLGKVSGQG